MLVASEKAHKTLHKLRFYAQHATHRLIPTSYLQQQRIVLLRSLNNFSREEQQQIRCRVDYYNRLDKLSELPDQTLNLANFKLEKSGTYYLDLLSILRYFPSYLYFCHRFGDVTTVPPMPTIVKSRPISDHNKNSVILKLNQVRHYYIVKDTYNYNENLTL